MCRRYEPSMRAVIRRYTNNPMDAEDWLNTSWVIALTKIRDGQLRVPEALAGFLCGVARRVAAGELRQRWRRDVPSGPEELENLGGQLDTQRTAAARELAELTHGLLNHLTVERDRQMLDRCFFGGEEESQVGVDLQLNPTQFGKVLYRARQRLWRAAGQGDMSGSLKELFSETA